VALNRAVATRFAIGPAEALAEVEPLAGELDDYRLYHAVRAELLTGLGRHEQARSANVRALALAANTAERELLARRLSFLPSRQIPPHMSAARVTSPPWAGPRS